MNAPRFVAAIIALSAIGTVGCKSGDKSASTPAKPAAAKPADAKKPADSKAAAKPADSKAAPAAKPADKAAPAPAAKAAEKPAPAPAAKPEEKPAPAPTAKADEKPAAKPAEQPAPAPAAKADDKAAPAAKPATAADDKLTPLAKDRQVLKEKREQLIVSYTEMGDKAFAESRFEEAEVAYGNVLDLDPKNEKAQRRLEEVGAILGKRPMDERTAFRDSVETHQVRVQQAKVEVANLAAQAQSKAKNGEYETAVAMYDKALVIANLYPANVDFAPSVEGLKTLRDATRKSADSAVEARRKNILKEAGDQTQIEAARQRAARRERLSTLFKKANEAMERNDYQTARNLAEEILKSEPNSDEAKRLRRISVDAASAAVDEAYHRQLLDEWKHVFEALSEAYMPQVDDYTFPSTWEEIQKNRTPPVLSTAKNMTEDPQNREVRNKLDGTRTTVQFHNVTLTDAADYLHRIANVNIIILQNAKEGKSDADLTIESLALDQPVQVSGILTLITDLKGLAWNIENGVVQITTKQAAQGAFIVQLYDVKDLATPVSNFPGDEINLDPKGEHAAKEEPKEPVAAFVLDNIGELITNNVDKTVWEGGGSVEPVPPGTLVIKCPATTHVKVQQLLDGLRGAGGLQVSIETRFITVQDNFLQEVGADLRGLGDQTGGVGVPGRGGVVGPGGVVTPVTFDDVFFGTPGAPAGGGTGSDTGVYHQISSTEDIRARFENLYDVALGKPGVLTNSGGLSFQGTYLDKTQVEVILRAVEKNDRATLVTAPRLTAFNGQRANVTILNQQSYISDFDVEIAQASQIGDPIVQVIRDGTILDLRPVVSSDRRFITMELRPTIAVLTRPIATFQTTLANGPPVTIQLPELQVQRVRTTVTVPDGGTLLLGGLKFLQEQRLDSTIPFVDKIPIASFFASRKGTYLEKRNVLILIRARILRPEENEPGSPHKL